MISLLKKHGRTTTLILAGGILTLICSLLYIHEPLFFQYVNGKIHDVYLERLHTTKTSGLPVIVDIDEKSLARFGQWPWPRYRVALLMEGIRAGRPSTIALDIIFAEPDRTSLARIRKTLKRDLHFDLDLGNTPKGLLDNDQILAAALQRSPATLSFFLNMDSQAHLTESRDGISPLQIPIVKAPGAPDPFKLLLGAENAVEPLPSFNRAAKHSGFTNTIPDRDGILRRTPLLMAMKGKIYPSLALASLLTALHDPPLTLKVGAGGIESLRLGPTIIPLDRNGRILINYRGPQQTFPYISAADVLDGKIPAKSFTGHIVIIGSSAAGLKDIRNTPLDPVYPGMEAQATVADTILAGDFLLRPDWTPGLELSLVLLAGCLTTLLITFASVRWILPIVLLVLTGLWLGGLYLFGHFHLSISPLVPMITIGSTFAILTVMKFRLEERDKRFLRSAFSRYVAPTVVDQITSVPESLSLAGEEKEMSILFTDLKGFTTMSEKLKPTQVTELLRDYFTPMTHIIIEHRGTVDKFIGDAMMAFWNAPLEVPDHRTQAVKAALAMTLALKKLNTTIIEPQFGFPIGMGIGVHAGQVRVGNMGSEDLFDYTVIGDNVNLASRLEGLTRIYGVDMVMSEALADSCPADTVVIELDRVQVKGKKKAVTIFTVYKEEHVLARLASRFHEGLELYRHRNFARAEGLFSELAAEAPENNLLFSLYHERCRTAIKQPPQDDWDGVFKLYTK